MTELSPAASAVWEAFNQDEAGVFLDCGDKLSKALHAIADVALPRNARGMVDRQELRSYILSIAIELEGD